MISVLDASAAAELVLLREGGEEIEARVVESTLVLAPMLYVSEVTNIFWKYYHFEDMPQSACIQGIERCLGLPDRLADDSELWRESFAMSSLVGKSAYDMIYLVLARRYNAMLLTMDKGLKAVCKKHSVDVV